MQEPTLQQVLENNYGVTEKIWAEGKFVALIGNSKTAKSLVSIGLGQNNLYIATVVVSGPVIDYELKCLTPLKLVYLIYDNAMKIITVVTKFKATQMYQLCTSQYEESVWDDFTSFIRYMGVDKSSEVWIEQPLSASPSDRNEEARAEAVDKSLLSEFFPSSQLACQCIIKNQTRRQASLNNQALRSISLPVLLPTAADDFQLVRLCRQHSFDCVDIRFDNFVNDAPTRFSEFSSSYTSCSWTGSADDLSRIETDNLNVNNNAQPCIKDVARKADTTEKGGFFAKLKGLFSFKKPPSF